MNQIPGVVVGQKDGSSVWTHPVVAPVQGRHMNTEAGFGRELDWSKKVGLELQGKHVDSGKDSY
jgi:hypothetical protein